MNNEMPAGRELDALIAKQVFNHHLSQWWCEQFTTYEWLPAWEEGRGEMQPVFLAYEDKVDTENGEPEPVVEGYPLHCWEPVPCYSVDVAAAWQIVDAVIEMPQVIRFDLTWHERCLSWRAEFVTEPEGALQGRATGDTAALAICRAALLACEREEK